MDERDILNSVTAIKQNFGVKCTKYAGAVTVESIKQALEQEKIPVSVRDVYIRGIPFEIDLLITKPGASSENGLLYKPDDVLFVLEVKNSGTFSADNIVRIERCFSNIQKIYPAIQCIYITLTERKGYIHAITEEKLGHAAFTLFSYSGSDANRNYTKTGDWQRFLNYIRSNQGLNILPTQVV